MPALMDNRTAVLMEQLKGFELDSTRQLFATGNQNDQRIVRVYLVGACGSVFSVYKPKGFLVGVSQAHAIQGAVISQIYVKSCVWEPSSTSYVATGIKNKLRTTLAIKTEIGEAELVFSGLRPLCLKPTSGANDQSVLLVDKS